MRLEDYWGVGPKTSALLAESLGVPAAVEAIDAGDIGTLVAAGLSRGRATRILRYASGGEAMALLETRDARDVYNQLLDTMGAYAVTEGAADAIRIMTPLGSQEAIEERLDEVLEARTGWVALAADEREAVLSAFERYDEHAGRRATVETALELAALELEGVVFEPLATLDTDALETATAALAGLEGDASGVADGADETLDELRTQLGVVEDLAAAPDDVLATIQSGAREASELRDALAGHVVEEADVDLAFVREAMPDEAADARSFVTGTLRTLAGELRATVDERETALAAEFERTLEETAPAVDAATAAVSTVALALSLARFAEAFELTRPQIREGSSLAVADARNVFLERARDDIQPVTYAIGTHALSTGESPEPPTGDRVAVLTGANSGGKTTLLETLCQIQLLAQMGLPVPAAEAEVSLVDAIVFHRRHASFNAGVLESTLRSVVPPVTESGRTLMLVDEFEAITEPGRAADLLHGLVQLTVDRGALGVFVTHLADDLEPLPEEARTDGIFAEGLTPELELEVDYQPRFDAVGRSTPEFIVSRLVAEATDPQERSGYETLARAVGEQAVQRTLADARWSA